MVFGGQKEGYRKMKITKKAAVKTVAAPKAACTKKCAAPKKAAKKPVEKSVTFTLRADAGKTVYVAGCFNQWDPEGKQMADKKGEGVYTATLKLAPGRYEYKFVVDGIWCSDPENVDEVLNDHGTKNSVLIVK